MQNTYVLDLLFQYGYSEWKGEKQREGGGRKMREVRLSHHRSDGGVPPEWSGGGPLGGGEGRSSCQRLQTQLPRLHRPHGRLQPHSALRHGRESPHLLVSSFISLPLSRSKRSSFSPVLLILISLYLALTFSLPPISCLGHVTVTWLFPCMSAITNIHHH